MNNHNKPQKSKLEELISKQMDAKDSTPINKYEIRNYIYYGFENEKLRPQYWKILMDYYPNNKYLHEKYYNNARKSYHEINNNINHEDEKIKNIKSTIKSEIERSPLIKDAKTKDAIEKILLVFCVCNSSIGYVQGMINIVNVIYSVMSNDQNNEDSNFAEEDTFQLFNRLVSEMSNMFLSEYDKQNKGLLDKVDEVFNIVYKKDPKLSQALIKKELHKVMFPVRWILLLFSAEYEEDDIFWLWDKILSDSSRFELLLYLSASIIILMRDIIIAEDFEKCVLILQKPHLVAPKILFKHADELRRENTISEILSSDKKNKVKK